MQSKRLRIRFNIFLLKVKIFLFFRKISDLEEDVMFHCITQDQYLDESQFYIDKIYDLKDRIKELRLSLK